MANKQTRYLIHVKRSINGLNLETKTQQLSNILVSYPRYTMSAPQGRMHFAECITARGKDLSHVDWYISSSALV